MIGVVITEAAPMTDRIAELANEIDLRIAEYLALNKFATLVEAADREWGDTRPLDVPPDDRIELE